MLSLLDSGRVGFVGHCFVWCSPVSLAWCWQDQLTRMTAHEACAEAASRLDLNVALTIGRLTRWLEVTTRQSTATLHEFKRMLAELEVLTPSDGGRRIYAELKSLLTKISDPSLPECPACAVGTASGASDLKGASVNITLDFGAGHGSSDHGASQAAKVSLQVPDIASPGGPGTDGVQGERK